MTSILDNLKVISPFFLFFWGLTIIGTALRPYKYRNALFLMGALFFTLVFIAGLFGSNIGTALLVIFLVCMALLFLVPYMLVLNGVIMLKKEGPALSHLLSLGLGLMILAGEAAVTFNVLNQAWISVPKGLDAAVLLIGSGTVYFSILILAFVLYMILLEFMPHRRGFDYIIIHGCGLRADGTVTKLLSNRLDKAIKVYNRSKGRRPVLIPSGGQGADEVRSEAEAMSEYLIARGIPRENILPEDRSTTTEENLRYSRQLIDSRGGHPRVALVSSNYHIYRCLSIASGIGLRCSGIGAHTAYYYWPSAVLREFAAFASKKRALIPIGIGFVLFSLLPTLTLLLAAA